MSPPARLVSLTGIKPTGEPHLGNYVGMYRPALDLAQTYESIYFIADHHALTTVRDPKLMRHYTRSVAAAWIACGLDPKQTIFYRQSDIPEIFEITWVMACLTGKGLMNRAHAYKAARDRNAADNNPDLDAGISMGLYLYPILMAVDILIMQTDVVPVGRDQVQHVEYAADIAGYFNHAYGAAYRFKQPKPLIPETETAQALPGLDGKKMSKSYNNTIPLFAPSGALKKLVRQIKTDATPVEAPKNADASIPFQVLQQFASPEETAAVRARLEPGGMGWGELKDVLFEVLDRKLAPMRARYDGLMDPSSELDALLAEGGARARERATPALAAVKRAIGM